MSELKIDDLRKLCLGGSIKWTMHVLKRMRERKINTEQIFETILNGEIIEQYPSDKPIPSCLIHAVVDGEHIHIVLSSDGNFIYMITAYYPNDNDWENNFIIRKEVL